MEWEIDFFLIICFILLVVLAIVIVFYFQERKAGREWYSMCETFKLQTEMLIKHNDELIEMAHRATADSIYVMKRVLTKRECDEIGLKQDEPDEGITVERGIFNKEEGLQESDGGEGN